MNTGIILWVKIEIIDPHRRLVDVSEILKDANTRDLLGNALADLQ